MQLMQQPGKSVVTWWSYQMVWNDAVPQFFFVCALATTLRLWTPAQGVYLGATIEDPEEQAGLTSTAPAALCEDDVRAVERVGERSGEATMSLSRLKAQKIGAQKIG